MQLLNKDRVFDLVITDQVMPEMTGSELVTFIKGRRPALPAIVATGFAELELGAALPASVVKLGKPFSHRDLAGAIEAAVGVTAG